MKKRPINIKEFSRLVGVSTATVSRAFNSKGRISEKTRQFIRDKAEEFGYRANVNARNLTLKHSDTIAFFYPELIKHEPDYFITEIMLGISDAVERSSRLLQIHPFSFSLNDHLEFYKEVILNGSISGIIVVAGTKASAELVEIAKIGNVPYIIIGSMSGERNHTVVFRLEKGAEQAGKYLKKIGRKNPAYVGGLLDRRKKTGYKKGLASLAERVVFDPGGSTFHHGSLAFSRLIKHKPKLDSVFCANDILAIGFIKEAIAQGIRIPDDIAVIGFDDTSIAKYYSPALTTVRVREFEIGESAVRQLYKRINGEELVIEEVVDCELIIRESA